MLNFLHVIDWTFLPPDLVLMFVALDKGNWQAK
jgi:hypothetical protein